MHTLAGTGTPGFAGDGGTATAAELDGAGAVAVYDPGLLGIFHGLKVYITDPNNSRVRGSYLSPPLEVP